jgi:hypothetical protein
LGLVQRLYPDRRFRGGQVRHEDPLLKRTHPLSTGLNSNPLLVRDRDGRGIGRCAVTFWTDSPIAYRAVDDAYRGLGPALTLSGLARAARLGVPGIGALMLHAAPTACSKKTGESAVLVGCGRLLTRSLFRAVVANGCRG